MILLNFEMDYPRQAGFSIFGGKRNGKIRKLSMVKNNNKKKEKKKASVEMNCKFYANGRRHGREEYVKYL